MKILAAALVAILLALATPASAESVHTEAAAPCPADSDPSGLIEALRTLDLEAASHAATIIAGYQRERAILCGRLEQHQAMLAALQERLAFRQALLDLQVQDTAATRLAYEQALNRPAAKRQWFGCGPGMGIEAGISGEANAGFVVACIIPLFP